MVDIRPVVIETLDENIKYNNMVEEYGIDDFADEPEEISEETIIENARKKAERIIEEATTEAEQIIQNIRQLAAAERAEARQEGLNEGYDEGYAKSMADAESARLSAEKVIEQAHELKAEIIAQAEPEIMQLVSKLVQKLLLNEAELNSKVIAVLVKAGLSQTSLNGAMTVRVSPADYSNLMEHRNEMLSTFEGLADISFESDEAIRQNECLIDTAFGTVDCGLGVQSKELIKSLNYLLKNR